MIRAFLAVTFTVLLVTRAAAAAIECSVSAALASVNVAGAPREAAVGRTPACTASRGASRLTAPLIGPRCRMASRWISVTAQPNRRASRPTPGCVGRALVGSSNTWRSAAG
jgi:hypothetical protein